MRAPAPKCKISAAKYLLLDRRRSFERQQDRLDLFLLLAGLKACGSTRDLDSGKRIHSDAIEAGFHATNYVMNSLVHMYAKCESMELSRQIFDTMDHRTVVSWNSLILGYAANGQGSTALDLFHGMEREDGSSSPNSRTFVAVLTACSSLASREEPKVMDGKLVRLGSLEKGRMIHSQARKNGCDSDTFVSNSLIDMYSKCGSVVEARQIFDVMLHRSIVSWNSMMLGYVENGEPEQALGLFSRLERQGGGVLPDARTLVAGLMACSSLAKRAGDDTLEKILEKGVELHWRAKQLGYESQLFVANTLIDMYSKCGSLEKAKLVFDSMPARDVVSWNSLLLGFSESGDDQKMVLELFQQMQAERFAPNSRTFVAVIGACSALAAAQSKKKARARDEEEAWLDKGVAIHGQAVIAGCDTDLFVASSLVDVYAKCGSMELARKVFDSMPRHDTVSWNTLILGYSDNGESHSALESFARMRREASSRLWRWAERSTPTSTAMAWKPKFSSRTPWWISTGAVDAPRTPRESSTRLSPPTWSLSARSSRVTAGLGTATECFPASAR
ncbi:pentatricopeptide repeat-containing protein At1g11290, chloroplastic-like isoform X2 [Selaginella moellendorffii]|uniref:pentatricopeptide repeat-containing protein At1g11290, chloroplastic-like isoform X2 n=1 Tax=Selaginella moellendorffii TaxID=88036 RepID=UPI000D1C925E|nr:pentatricopeptide repeat-containing protein At1g11290, chloroplastic-like isoform X2 [Selaginella moellendorffii]|eukprot:XP_024543687.1 pentatricopeptide repeat-containing protein At1g11290, chloroplastic-like isoform X2 [Selaginella moellendorffii]